MNLRPRDRIALGVVIVAALVGVFYFLALKPEQQKVTSLNAAIATQRSTLSQEQQAYNVGRAAQATIRSESAQWAALHVAVPEQSDIPALLRILTSNAKAANVKLNSITLGGGSGVSTGATPSTSTSSAGATGVPVQLTFAGGYDALNALVHRLDSLVVVSGTSVHARGPLMSIGNVSLSGAPGDETVQMNATIYQLSAASTATGGQP